MTAALCFIFFVSGCAALLFEALWFRQAHLAFGSSLWASSLVLSSFMSGVALGNALAARFGARARRPLRTYALLEVAIGLLGLGLVVGLPKLGPLLVFVLRPFLDNDAILQPLRFVLAFVLLLGPAVAMGATLPLLTAALSRSTRDFGSALGALYGWNTIGAVLGAIAGELFLIERLGVRGSGVVAMSLNLVAALAVLGWEARHGGRAVAAPEAPKPQPARRVALAWRERRLLLAAFLAGGLLLALEVVWFRLLVLFVAGTSLTFALMLAVVLAGIGFGGLLASLAFRLWPRADRHAPAVALAAGALGALGYTHLDLILRDSGGHLPTISGAGLGLALWLMLPAALASGVLFPMLGKTLNDTLDLPTRSTGLLTLANTLGAAIGPIFGGFFLLPRLGVEGSIFALCLAYAGVAACAWPSPARLSAGRALAALVFGAAILTFPSGQMADTFLPLSRKNVMFERARLVAVREGPTETIQYTRVDFLGRPVSHQLITNGYSMSGSGPVSRRYMNLYVHLAVALHPELRDALLISYGVGNTAKTLTRVSSLQRIDVVDISRDILELSSVVYPDPGENPLRDPRVTVHVEDGRYFLQSTTRSFDLITGEPPPPRLGNVTYLYTEEYFGLAHDRLNPGGLITYWLPVDQLSPGEAAAIIAGFCNVFEDCTLWNGGSLNWMLVGSRGGIEAVTAEALARPWQDPELGPDLRSIGIESPAQLGALFVADTAGLETLARSRPPLRDDFPLRIANAFPTGSWARFEEFQASQTARMRFLQSPLIRRIWPEALRRDTLREFHTTALVDRAIGVLSEKDPIDRLALLRHVLESTDQQALSLWLLGREPIEVEIASRWDGDAGDSVRERVEHTLGFGALARRDWAAAARHLRIADQLQGTTSWLSQLAIYAFCRAGERDAFLWLREEAFRDATAAGADSAEARGIAASARLGRERGENGCWAAAWRPDWRLDSTQPTSED